MNALAYGKFCSKVKARRPCFDSKVRFAVG
jgi:hypothetical protein